MQSFEDAEAVCTKQSGSLVAMEDMEEQVMQIYHSSPGGC